MRFNSSIVNNFVIVYGAKKKKRKNHVNIIRNFTNYLVKHQSQSLKAVVSGLPSLGWSHCAISLSYFARLCSTWKLVIQDPCSTTN